MERYLVHFLMCVAVASAGTSVWDGSDGDWMDQEHWSGDGTYLVPGWVTDNPNNDGTWTSNSNKSSASIESGTAHLTGTSRPDGRVERIYVKNGGQLNTSGDYRVYRFHVGNSSGTAGSVTQTSGFANVSKFYLGENGGSGTYTLSNGSLELRDEAKIGNDGTAVFNQQGGAVTVSAGTLEFSAASGQSATYNMTGGTFSSNRIKLGVQGSDQTSGNINVSGGSFSVSKYMSVYSGTDSTFRVIGSNADSITFAQLSVYDETLAIDLDAGGSTLIEVFGTELDTYNGANLEGATLLVDTLGDFDGALGDIYDVLWSATTINTSGLQIMNSGDVMFDYSVVDDMTRGGQMLQVTVVPEPATMALLLLGGVFVNCRKRV